MYSLSLDWKFCSGFCHPHVDSPPKTGVSPLCWETMWNRVDCFFRVLAESSVINRKSRISNVGTQEYSSNGN
ncbi:MAG: hypothetical protein DWI02_12440 [Planctomycetota bacterium]|nr:MAG: hypothetical protein DWI02_12440 [Planctomycetota bacterium]